MQWGDIVGVAFLRGLSQRIAKAMLTTIRMRDSPRKKRDNNPEEFSSQLNLSR